MDILASLIKAEAKWLFRFGQIRFPKVKKRLQHAVLLWLNLLGPHCYDTPSGTTVRYCQLFRPIMFFVGENERIWEWMYDAISYICIAFCVIPHQLGQNVNFERRWEDKCPENCKPVVAADGHRPASVCERREHEVARRAARNHAANQHLSLRALTAREIHFFHGGS